MCKEPNLLSGNVSLPQMLDPLSPVRAGPAAVTLPVQIVQQDKHLYRGAWSGRCSIILDDS